MKLWIPTVLAIAFFLPFAAAGDEQTGSGASCAESLALYDQGISTGESRVVVGPDTVYSVSADFGTAYVDFFDAGDNWLGWNAGDLAGVVPTGAAYGVMCVGESGGLVWPFAPLPTSTWTYQDGA